MDAPIGVFDSGIGGLSVLKALQSELPWQDFIYIADSGHAPYGERDEAHVVARSLAIAAQLVGHEIKALVVACNTATAAAIHLLRAAYPDLPIIGVEPALRPAAALSKTGHIGVLATRSTLASVKFQALHASMASQIRFILQPCDGLASAIERQLEDSDATELIAMCVHYIMATGQFGHGTGDIDTLVLGCTHYPFASEHLTALLPAGIQLVATGEAVARQTRRVIEKLGKVHAGVDIRPEQTVLGQIQILTTGQPHTLQIAARHWLGLDVSVCKLNI